jgi:hypoxanthine phosphoribosyltransferase
MENAQILVQLHDLSFKPYLSASAIGEKVNSLGEELSKEYEGKKPLLVAIMNGSFMFAADLMRAISIDCEITFIKVFFLFGYRKHRKSECYAWT